MRKFDYENKLYLDKLDVLEISYYSKFIKFVEKFLPNKSSKFLDVGCGNGAILEQLKNKGYKNGFGVEISKLFIKSAKSKGVRNVYFYDGVNLPFKKEFFDLIGSFNVLEHTENPEKFLEEEISKLKKGGILIVACPNFLSVIFPSYHRRLKGMRNKIKNFTTILKKLISSNGFEMMKPVIRKNFQYDDDAIVVTNIIDLAYVLKKNNCTILYESGFINFDTLIFKIINLLPFAKFILPSCFVVAQKN